jgi:hypothetical protein
MTAFRPSLLRTALVALCIPALCIGIANGSGGGKKASHGSGHGSKKETKKSHGAKEASHAAPREGAPVSDVEALLSIIASKERKHDPRLYVEVDLGEFRITHPGATDEDLFLVKFHIFGVMHERDQLKFAETLVGREQRLRGTILSVVHKTHYEVLSDPSLDAVKSDLVAAINRVLETGVIRDVAFSSFSMEPG